MINYPDGRKVNWHSNKVAAGNRGMDLEKEINITNQFYLAQDTAVIHKKPTPVQVVSVSYPKRSAARITEAYYKVPSTTDYNGIYRGKYLDFEAKECAERASFPFKSLHPHQLTHLEAVQRHGGIAFLIVRFTSRGVTFLADAGEVIQFYRTADRSSIPFDWFAEHGHPIGGDYLRPVDYLKTVDRIYFTKGGNAL